MSVGDLKREDYERKWVIVRVKGAKVSGASHASHCIGCYIDAGGVAFNEPLRDMR